MKKLQITFIIGIMLSIIIGLTSSVKATTLTITPTASSSNIKKGETVTVTVGWSSVMESAGYILNYDSSKMQFVSASIGSNYYKVSDGKVTVAWATGDSLSSMSFTFRAISDNGTAKFSVTIDGGFMDGNLVKPDNYNTNATASVNLSSNSSSSDGEQSNQGTSGGESSDASTSGQSATNPQTTPSKLPHAGKENLVLLFIGVGAMAVFSFYKMNKYRKF